jgi:hypothetical protein
MSNQYGLSRRTRLLLWLLAQRPDVDAVNLLATRQYLKHCLDKSTESYQR